MRILLLCHAFNGLTQRLHTALREDGHVLSVELDIADSVTEEAVRAFKPDIVLASFLKRRLPESIWRACPCWVVHPGPPGDRGPAALDWAVWRQLPAWGVTVLQANGEFDAGPVLAHEPLALRAATKASLYRQEVCAAACRAVRRALAGVPPEPPAATGPQGWQPPMTPEQRHVDWAQHDSAEILRRARAADSVPGALARLWGEDARCFDVHLASAQALAQVAAEAAAPGTVLARRGPAWLVRTVDGGVWIGQVRRAPAQPGGPTLKLAATRAFEPDGAALPELAVPLLRGPAWQTEWDELHLAWLGPPEARVAWLSFDFHNGAMSTRQCLRLRDALRALRELPMAVLVLAGGADFFSNGIHLHEIESADGRDGDSAADASMRNIEAMDDVCLEILTMTDRLTVSALRGNAGAGGCFLAFAADRVWAHEGVVLNPHYKNMGNLYGSEYWTYTLPRRVGAEQARQITQGRLPIGAAEAHRLGLLDAEPAPQGPDLVAAWQAQALALAASPDLAARLAAKQAQRAEDEARQPLAAYRAEELRRMHRNFYGFDPSYHVARHHFVHRKPHAWTPRHLAVHR